MSLEPLECYENVTRMLLECLYNVSTMSLQYLTDCQRISNWHIFTFPINYFNYLDEVSAYRHCGGNLLLDISHG